MTIPLTATRYLLTTDDLLAGWDQKSWIESADDRQTPDTSSSSFDELEAAAVAGGPGSDAEKVRDQIIAVLSADAGEAEGWVESFCTGIYALPLFPVDRIATALMLDWMRHRMRSRHDLYRNPEMQIAAERSLITRGTYLRNEMTRLTAARTGQGANLNESIAAFGSDTRRNGDLSTFADSTLSGGPFNSPFYRR